MTETADTHGPPAAGATERDAADIGLLIFTSLKRIREKVRREREHQRAAAAPSSSTTAR